MKAIDIIRGMSLSLLESRIQWYRDLLERERSGSGKIHLPHMVPAWTEGLRMAEDVYRKKIKQSQVKMFK